MTPSLKLTHLGLDLGEEIALENVERVLDRAGETWVWIDMEGSAYTERTLAIYRRLRRRWRNVAGVLQASLHRTEADLRGLVPGGLRVRLCKGAYREPSDRAFPRKGDVDRNYARLAGMLFSKEAQAAGAYAAFATHDERLVRVIADRAREFGLAPDRYEFQMLHGIRPGAPPDAPRPRGAAPRARALRGGLVRLLRPAPRRAPGQPSLLPREPRPTLTGARRPPGAAGAPRAAPIPRLTGATAPPYHAMSYG